MKSRCVALAALALLFPVDAGYASVKSVAIAPSVNLDGDTRPKAKTRLLLRRPAAAYTRAGATALGIRGGQLDATAAISTAAAAAATTVGSASGAASVGLKVGLQAALTALNVACWLVPLNMRSFVDSPGAMSLANAFSGGVFLALAMGHLLPHSIHDFAALESFAVDPALAGCALALAGYMLVFVVEKMAFDTDALLDAGTGAGTGAGAAEGEEGVTEGEGWVQGGDGITEGGGGGGGPQAGSSLLQGRGLGAVLLLSALAVHSLVEAAALGVQSKARSAFLIATSVGLHQPAESVALLVALLKAQLSKRHIVILLGLFSCVGPLGMGLGLAAKELVGGAVEPALVALTAGTFLYVGATEVVAEEFDGGHGGGGGVSKRAKFASLCAGLVTIAAVVAVTEKLEATASSLAL